MKPFTFFKVTDSKAISTIEVELYDTLDEARMHAEEIVSEGRHVAVEIFDGASFFVVDRTNADSHARAS